MACTSTFHQEEAVFRSWLGALEVSPSFSPSFAPSFAPAVSAVRPATASWVQMLLCIYKYFKKDYNKLKCRQSETEDTNEGLENHTRQTPNRKGTRVPDPLTDEDPCRAVL